MKKSLLIILLAVFALGAHADDKKTVKVPSVTNDQITRNGSNLEVKMEIPLSELTLNRNQAVALIPTLINGNDSIDLEPIGFYGRTRWIQYERLGKWLTGENEDARKQWGGSEVYSQAVPYQEWMNGSHLRVRTKTFSCCYNKTGEDMLDLTYQFREAQEFPVKEMMHYMRPQADSVKTVEISGTAWIQFPVDTVTIFPHRFNNPAELGKIHSSIDPLYEDGDITIDLITLKGFASPESPYAHNTELAQGRVASLRDYINNRYKKFPMDLVQTDYEPEDWTGLRAKVVASTYELQHRDEILAIIDDPTMSPDQKEAKMKSNPKKNPYYADWKFMLDNWFPALRHTDYNIKYHIRNFTTSQEALAIYRKDPRKMSSNEFYLAAQALPFNSDEFVELWETAVRLFPDDEAANANAAATALLRHDVAAAERYLSKAGNSIEAEFNRGILAVLKDDYDTAQRIFERAQKQGVKEATQALETLEMIRKYGRVK